MKKKTKDHVRAEIILTIFTILFIFGFSIINTDSVTGLVTFYTALAESATHNLRMFTLGLQGDTPEGATYESRMLSTTFQPGDKDGESASYSANIGFFSAPTAPDVVTPGVGGGVSRGGQSMDCYYDWDCTKWFPYICPAEGIQKRSCFNRGTCSGLRNKPSEIQNCIPETKRPLFDLFLRIPRTYKWLLSGEEVLANLELINVRDTTQLDVFLKYWIIDINNTLIYEQQETRSVEQGVKFGINIGLSKKIKPGLYRLFAQASYDLDKIVIAEDSFEIIESKFKQFTKRFLYFILLAIIIFNIIRHYLAQNLQKEFKNPL